MFHDFNDESANDNGHWRRIKRPIFSSKWRFIHNLIAHPLLAIYRPLGELAHSYTAKKMYEDNGSKPVSSDND